MVQLNQTQQEQIIARGSEINQVETQLQNFEKGFDLLDLDRPASIGDGIIRLSASNAEQLVQNYEKKVAHKALLKFVPASGAATRMFKDLFEFLSTGELNEHTEKFISGIKQFAFYDSLNQILNERGENLTGLIESKNYEPIIAALLNPDGLGYSALPKGLLAFHKEDNQVRTPLEEHLVEGAEYAADHNGNVKIHFTVSPEHIGKFNQILQAVKTGYEKKFNVTYQVSFSLQKKSTDTIAVDMDNLPFYEKGELLFRPAGHGALLENLNDLEADLIFIKNIDNVVPDHLKGDTIKYKKALASLLLDFQRHAFDWLKRMSDQEDCFEHAIETLKSKFNLSVELKNQQELQAYLNRPIRVCGMVENTGEPGGGPFWVKHTHGNSLQIAETAQINLDNPAQAEILKKSTHFNPVDLICAVKDFEGNKFDLLKFRDNTTGFITRKSKGGKDLKAMELPGLWNGAMANWITLFVEVPISTFNPVKTVNDLLKPNHQ